MDIPFVSGGRRNYLEHFTRAPESKNYKYVNQTLECMAKENSLFGYASAEDLTHKGDILHLIQHL